MDNYLEIIKYAIIFFPFVALIFSAPFLIEQYHKYGSLSFLRGLILYSFILYLMCAYFLVILPLPEVSEVAKLTTPRTQFIPFIFIYDFITNVNIDLATFSDLLKIIKTPYFYVPVFNLFLTLPFGMYLRYYFNCSIKKIMLFSFLLSLFFELTQLSGLYFIYPRGYRLFDVDDLILNTLGGILGGIIATPIKHILPSKEKIDEKAIERGKRKISGLRRTVALFGDLFIASLIWFLGTRVTDNEKIINLRIIPLTVFLLYFVILPLILRGSTIMEKFLNIKVVDEYEKFNFAKTLLRKTIFTIIYVIIPYIVTKIFGIILSIEMDEFFVFIFDAFYFVFIIGIYGITLLKYLLTSKPMIYEKLSHTKTISTIK